MAALVADQFPPAPLVVAQGKGAVGAGGLVPAVGAEEEGAIAQAGRKDQGLPPLLLHLPQKGPGPSHQGIPLLLPQVQQENPRLGYREGQARLFQDLHRGHQGKVGEGHAQKPCPELRQGRHKGPGPRGKLVALASLFHHHQGIRGEGEEKPAIGGENQAPRLPKKGLPHLPGKAPMVRPGLGEVAEEAFQKAYLGKEHQVASLGHQTRQETHPLPKPPPVQPFGPFRKEEGL